VGKSADTIATREQVYRQLSRRFPAAAVDWVRSVPWSGPVKLSTDDINSEGSDSWQASHDPKGVADHIQKLRDGTSRPVVLVQVPSGRLDLVDGHHRFLAAKSEGKPLQAFIGVVPRDTGPWSETHLSQKGGDSG